MLSKKMTSNNADFGVTAPSSSSVPVGSVPGAAGTSSVPVSDLIEIARDTEIATEIPCAVIDNRGTVLYPVQLRDYPCRMCRLAAGGFTAREGIAAEHVEQGRRAERSGGVQIFLCDRNLMHWAVPVPVGSGGGLAAVLVGGPVRLAGGETEFETDVIAPLRRRSEVVARAEEASLRRLYEGIPVVSARRIDAISKTLHRAVAAAQAAASSETAGGAPAGHVGGSATGRERLARESRINEYMQELKRYRHEHGLQAGIPTYPLEMEQRLLDAIAAGDEERSQAILNELLGHVFFTLGADLERIKVRTREIVILLSRIVIARGADANRVFGYNYRALDELDGIDDINDLAHWTARIVRGFTRSVLHVPAGASHTTLLRRVVDYVEESYRGRVRLAAAAELGGVSPEYLSRVFSREMGETFSHYVRRIRVRHAEELLTATRLSIADIADLCGFTDQSHLTAAFRTVTGTTPAAYRKRG